MLIRFSSDLKVFGKEYFNDHASWVFNKALCWGSVNEVAELNDQCIIKIIIDKALI